MYFRTCTSPPSFVGFLVVHWLRLCTSTEEGSISDQGTKILYAAKKEKKRTDSCEHKNTLLLLVGREGGGHTDVIGGLRGSGWDCWS